MKIQQNEKSEENPYPISYTRRDGSILFTGRIGSALVNKWRKGDLCFDTEKYTIEGIGRVDKNTHSILGMLCAFNKNIQNLLLTGTEGNGLAETGNGFKVMVIQSEPVRQAYMEKNLLEKETNGDRKQRIIDFLVKEILKIFTAEGNQNTFNIKFEKLAKIGLGVESDKMVDLNEIQKQARIKRLQFLKDIQAKVALRINQHFAKRGMESEWNWDYGKKRLAAERKKKG